MDMKTVEIEHDFLVQRSTSDLDRWEDEGGFTECMNNTEKRNAFIHAESSAPCTAPKASATGFVLRDRIRAHLVNLSATDVPMTYGKLARAMGLHVPGSIAEVTQALEAIMVEDAENGAPFLASLVVSKVGHGNAAKGFSSRHARWVEDRASVKTTGPITSASSPPLVPCWQPATETEAKPTNLSCQTINFYDLIRRLFQ